MAADQTQTMSTRPLDPDPVAIAGLGIACVAAVLQLVQTYKSFRPSAPQPAYTPDRSNRRTQLMGLEQAVENSQRELRKITRAVDQGSKDSDAQFYDAPLRVAETELLLSQGEMFEYSQGFQAFAGLVGQVGSWINNILTHDPQLAYRLGERMGTPLEGTAAVINAALADGRSTRVVLTEVRLVLKSLAEAIEAELDGGNAG